MVLAQHQTDPRFVPRWFAACDEAAWGRAYWQTRLGTGLLGLRKLPTPNGTEPEMMLATALARFGALGLSRGMSSHLVERTFRQRAAAMTVLYPRYVMYWRDLWDAVLAEILPRLKGNVAMLSSWLGDTVVTDGERATERTEQRRASGLRVALPGLWRRERLEQDIEDTTDLDPDLFGRVRQLIRDHWRYAFASGESHYAVRTTTNLCNRILRFEVDESVVEKIHAWTLQAVEAEPENPYTWDLWAKVLSSLEQNDTALSVRWESLRRFPENSVLRNSLAYLLAQHDRTVLAENLLRETMEDFRDDPFCRNILANLLIRTEREQAAEHLLRETMRRSRHDIASRHTLTSMLWRQGRRDEAVTEMAALQAIDPDDPHVQRLAALIRERHQIPAEFAEHELKNIWVQAGIGQDLSPSRAHRTDPRTSWPWRLEPEPASDEPGTVRDGDGGGSAVVTYLSRLEARAGLLEWFFASLEHGAGAPRSALADDERTSELALVVAHRAGLLDGADRREELLTWIAVHPSSYSARLLLVWSGNEPNGLDRAALRAIEREFPEHREWNERLGYGFNAQEERDELPQEVASDGHVPSSDPWASRLVAVYPSLITEQDDAAAHFDLAAWRRLMEDIAFAGAERAVPSIAPR